MKHCINLLATLVLSIAIISCKSNKETPVPSSVATAPISFHFHPYIGQNEVDLPNAVYLTTDNRKISLSEARVYFSNIKLVKLDGTIYPLTDTIILTNIIDQVYLLGNVPIGNYKSIQFDVGLQAALNAQIPSKGGILNDPDMWFTNSAQANNYVFMNLAGKIDTTAAKNATDANMVPFVYKIGTNNHLIHISMPDLNVAVQPNTMAYIHMLADYSQLFNGLDLRNQNNLNIATSADNTTSLAINIAANMATMFRYEMK